MEFNKRYKDFNNALNNLNIKKDNPLMEDKTPIGSHLFKTPNNQIKRFLKSFFKNILFVKSYFIRKQLDNKNKSMKKLLQFITTITPFSKYLFMIIFMYEYFYTKNYGEAAFTLGMVIVFSIWDLKE